MTPNETSPIPQEFLDWAKKYADGNSIDAPKKVRGWLEPELYVAIINAYRHLSPRLSSLEKGPVSSGSGDGWISADNPPQSEHDEWLGPFIGSVATSGGVDFTAPVYYCLDKWYWVENKKALSKDFAVTHYMEFPDPAASLPQPPANPGGTNDVTNKK